MRGEGENRRLIWTDGLGDKSSSQMRQDAPSRNTQKHNPMRKGTMTHTSAQEQQLSFTDAQHLLARQGYEMLDRFGHVHASRNAQEWHLCLITELASMPPTRLLARLDEALTLRVEHSIALSSLAHGVGANARRDGREPSIKQEAL